MDCSDMLLQIRPQSKFFTTFMTCVTITILKCKMIFNFLYGKHSLFTFWTFPFRFEGFFYGLKLLVEKTMFQSFMSQNCIFSCRDKITMIAFEWFMSFMNHPMTDQIAVTRKLFLAYLASMFCFSLCLFSNHMLNVSKEEVFMLMTNS